MRCHTIARLGQVNDSNESDLAEPLPIRLQMVSSEASARGARRTRMAVSSSTSVPIPTSVPWEMALRKLAILTFMTLDGVMQAPSDPSEDRSGEFAHGGWARPCWDEVMEQVMCEAMAEPYDLLLGRTTYDMFAASFPNSSPDNPVASKLNDATKYVITSNPNNLDWKNTVQVTGDLPVEIANLKGQAGPLLQVHGSWQLIQMLLTHQLVDEFRTWTFPVILGSGKKLFGSGTAPVGLSLKKSARCSNGATMSIYLRN